jgi:hypothetical protein
MQVLIVGQHLRAAGDYHSAADGESTSAASAESIKLALISPRHR